MKKILILLALISTYYLVSCKPAMYVIVCKEPTLVSDSCFLFLEPINQMGKFKSTNGATVDCNKFDTGDTVILKRNTYRKL